MRTIMFRFRGQVSEEAQSAELREISKWDGVSGTGRVSPASSRPSARATCWLQLDNGADGDRILASLQTNPLIETAYFPAERNLLAAGE
jgi:hypothetical protein